MLAAIGDATTCPHGHPIVEGAREAGVLLADVEPGASVHVLRFENEAEELLHYLKGTGLRPELEGEVEASDDDSVVLVSPRSEEHTSELQSRQYLVCRLLLEKKNKIKILSQNRFS